MNNALFGRAAEFDQVCKALVADDPGVVVIEGPAGIGKSALWRSLIDKALAEEWAVLRAAPSELEASMPLTAIADIVSTLKDRVADIPAPQRRAIDSALLADEHPLDERALGAAVCSLFEAAAADTPLLVAVDDAGWLDPPSERALRFALRQTASSNVAVVVTQRTDDGEPTDLPLGLDGVDPARLSRIDLGPLGTGALHHLLRQQLGATLSRPLLAKIARDSGGNPLLAVELTRAVLRLPHPPAPGDDLPVPLSLYELVADVLAAFQPKTLEAVRFAALLDEPNLAALSAVDVDRAALDDAEEAGLVSLRGTEVVFVHPVYVAVVRSTTPGAARRTLHGRLAVAASSPEERARHLARSSDPPDEAVAKALEQAARRVRSQGAPELAAELFSQALTFTPPHGLADAGRLRVAVAECQFESGDFDAAATALESAAAELSDDARASALLLRATVAWYRDEAAAPTFAETALASAPSDSPIKGKINAHLAEYSDNPEQAIRHGQSAISLLSDGSDPEWLSLALYETFLNEVRAGGRPRIELLDRAISLEGADPAWRASTVPGVWWKTIDDFDRARTHLEMLRERAIAGRDEPLLLEVLQHLSELELRAGRWHLAASHARAALELAGQVGAECAGGVWLDALVSAHRGELESAELTARQGIDRGREIGDGWYESTFISLAGFVALSREEPAAAAEFFGSLASLLDRRGQVEPLGQRFEPDWIESCVDANDLVTAKAALERLTDRHERLPRPWTRLGVARSRVLLDSAMGNDCDPALSDLNKALAAIPAGALPFDRARTLLVAGRAHRRVRRKKEARHALTAAEEEFEGLGAKGWAIRSRAEIARIGGRPPSPLELTTTEREVARLAAYGKTNREIAGALFISPKTVEANLSRVYRKLGVPSRVMLATALDERET